VGSTVASSLTAVSLTSLGWAGAFWLQAGIALVLAFGVSLLLIRDDPRGATAVGSAEVTHIEENRFESTDLIPKTGPQSPYRNYRYWLTMLMYLGTNIPFYGLVTWLPLYLREQRHVSFGMVGLILTAANALSIVVMIGVSMWSDRRMRRASVAAAGFAVEAIGILGAVLFPENTLVIGVWVFRRALERRLRVPDQPRRRGRPGPDRLAAVDDGQLHARLPVPGRHDRGVHRLLRRPHTAAVLTAGPSVRSLMGSTAAAIMRLPPLTGLSIVRLHGRPVRRGGDVRR
jgi:hypothetical protein